MTEKLSTGLSCMMLQAGHNANPATADTLRWWREARVENETYLLPPLIEVTRRRYEDQLARKEAEVAGREAVPREKAQAAPTARLKYRCAGGADCPAVVMKRGNARGAKGAGHRR